MGCAAARTQVSRQSDLGDALWGCSSLLRTHDLFTSISVEEWTALQEYAAGLRYVGTGRSMQMSKQLLVYRDATIWSLRRACVEILQSSHLFRATILPKMDYV